MSRSETQEFETHLSHPRRSRLKVASTSQIADLPPEAKPVIMPISPWFEDWVERCIRLNEARLGRLLGCFGIYGQDSKDVLQKVWVKLAQANLWHLAPEDIEAWLTEVARNLARDLLRSKKREEERNQVQGIAGLTPVDLSQADERDVMRWRRREINDQLAGDIAEERLESLHAAIDRLPKDLWSLIHDRFFEGLSVAEIAKRDRIPVRTVYRDLHLALTALKEILSRD